MIQIKACKQDRKINKRSMSRYYWWVFKTCRRVYQVQTQWPGVTHSTTSPKNIFSTSQNFDDTDLVEDFEATAIRYDQLNEKYQEYWIVHGGVAQSIRDQEWTFSEYELQLKTKSDSTTEAFTNIRWKTQLEQFTEQKQVSSGIVQSLKKKAIQCKPNSFNDFLNLSCKPSPLKHRLYTGERSWEEI